MPAPVDTLLVLLLRRRVYASNGADEIRIGHIQRDIHRVTCITHLVNRARAFGAKLTYQSGTWGQIAASDNLGGGCSQGLSESARWHPIIGPSPRLDCSSQV